MIGLSAPTTASLGDRFLPLANGLNLLRLTLAVGVIFWHSFPLTGRTVEFWPAHQLLSDLGVDGFFVISGFLIFRSWDRRPQLREFIAARILRIFPAYWVCLVVTGFVLAPIGILLQGGTLSTLFSAGEPLRYLWAHLLLWGGTFTINDTPQHVPLPAVWNGSLWTLGFEFNCYLAVVALGLLGLLKKRWALPSLFAVVTLGTIANDALGDHRFFFTASLRFGLVFLAGMLLYSLRDVLTVSPLLLAVSALVVILASMLPDYRVLAAFPLAYFFVGVSTYIRSAAMQFRTDISYGMYIYAFPVQQVLALAGLAFLPQPVFWIVATAITIIPAYASWLIIERPALSLKHYSFVPVRLRR